VVRDKNEFELAAAKLGVLLSRELAVDNIAVRVAALRRQPDEFVVEAWSRKTRRRVRIRTCALANALHGIAECLATTIREQLQYGGTDEITADHRALADASPVPAPAL
jgi:hypothetical protein